MTQPKRSLVDLQTQNRWLIWTHLFPESLHLVEVSLRYLRDRAVKWRGRNDGGQASACVRSCAHGVCRALTTILAALTLTAALALLLRPKTWATTECTLQHHAQDDEYLSYDKTKKNSFHAILCQVYAWYWHRCSFCVRRRDGDAALYSALAATSCLSFKLACCFWK